MFGEPQAPDFEEMTSAELDAYLATQQQGGPGQAPAAPAPPDAAPAAPGVEAPPAEAPEGVDEGGEGAEGVEPEQPAAPPPMAPQPQGQVPLPPDVQAALQRDQQAREAEALANLRNRYAQRYGDDVADDFLNAHLGGRDEIMDSLREELSATRQDLSLQFARAAFPDYEERMRGVAETMGPIAFGALMEASRSQENPALWLREATKAVLTPADQAKQAEAQALATKKAAAAAAKAGLAKLDTSDPAPPGLGVIGGAGGALPRIDAMTSEELDDLPLEELERATKAYGR